MHNDRAFALIDLVRSNRLSSTRNFKLFAKEIIKMSLREQLLNLSSTAPRDTIKVQKNTSKTIQRKFTKVDESEDEFNKSSDDNESANTDDDEEEMIPTSRSSMRTASAIPDYDERKFGKGVVVNVKNRSSATASQEDEDDSIDEGDDNNEYDDYDDNEDDEDESSADEIEDDDDDDVDDDNENEDSLLSLFKADAKESSKRATESKRDVIAGELAQSALSLRETILETRILMQKPLTLSQRLPRDEELVEALCNKDSEVGEKFEETKETLMDLLDDFIDLRFALVETVPEISSLVDLRRKEILEWKKNGLNNDAPISWWEQPKPRLDKETVDSNDYWRILSEGSSTLSHWRDSTLDAWNRRLILTSNPQSTLKKAEKTAGKSGVDISEQVRLALGGLQDAPPSFAASPTSSSSASQNDRSKNSSSQKRGRMTNIGTVGPRPSDNDTVFKLVKRVRAKLNSINVFGESEATEPTSSDNDGDTLKVDDETYQDGEFYATLLKEYVDSVGENGPSGSNEGLTKQPGGSGVINYKAGYAHTSRAGVDRRASKGRKIKYVVQPKLTHFCAPAPFVVPPDMALDIDMVVESLFKSS